METNSIISQIGNTPLVRLKQASELTGCNIYGKADVIFTEKQNILILVSPLKIELHYLL